MRNSPYHLKIDPATIENDNFISDLKLKDLLVGTSKTTINPNPDKYLECKVSIERNKENNYDKALKSLTRFDYDDKSNKYGNNRYYGPFFVHEEDCVFVGQMNGDRREGHGIHIYTDGNFYEGYFENDCTNKKGRLVFNNGDMFYGELKNLCMNGYGIYINNEAGSKYTGYFMNDAPDGEGKEEWNDGTVYIGNFKQGSKEGKGILKAAGGNVYEGNFVADYFNGDGSFTTADGTKFMGKWKNGELQSPGKILYKNDKRYDGELNKNMKPHGVGTLSTPGKKYHGKFKEGLMEGEITVEYEDGKTKKARYSEGKFLDWLNGEESLPIYAPKSVPTKDADINHESKLMGKQEDSSAKKELPAKPNKKSFFCCGS